MMNTQPAGPTEVNRRPVRARKTAERVKVVSEAGRKSARSARLEALENDDAAAGVGGMDSDDEYAPMVSDDDREHDQDAASKKRKGRVRGGVKRKTRAMLEVERRGPQTFAALLEEANLDQLPAHVPSYLTAAVGPPVGQATRKWCSVCGFPASYCCVRCGSRFCTRRCNSVHVETRCLKLVG